MWHWHFLEVFRVWLSREAAPREFSQLQVHQPLPTQKSWYFICYLKFLLHVRFW